MCIWKVKILKWSQHARHRMSCRSEKVIYVKYLMNEELSHPMDTCGSSYSDIKQVHKKRMLQWINFSPLRHGRLQDFGLTQVVLFCSRFQTLKFNAKYGNFWILCTLAPTKIPHQLNVITTWLLLDTVRGEPSVSYRWINWVCEITGWSSRLQENSQTF